MENGIQSRNTENIREQENAIFFVAMAETTPTIANVSLFSKQNRLYLWYTLSIELNVEYCTLKKLHARINSS